MKSKGFVTIRWDDMSNNNSNILCEMDAGLGDPIVRQCAIFIVAFSVGQSRIIGLSLNRHAFSPSFLFESLF